MPRRFSHCSKRLQSLSFEDIFPFWICWWWPVLDYTWILFSTLYSSCFVLVPRLHIFQHNITYICFLSKQVTFLLHSSYRFRIYLITDDDEVGNKNFFDFDNFIPFYVLPRHEYEILGYKFEWNVIDKCMQWGQLRSSWWWWTSNELIWKGKAELSLK